MVDETNLTGSDIRSNLIEEVKKCVCRDRQNTYGDAEDNFADIASLANLMLEKKLKEPLSPEDVAILSMCIKMARIKTSPDHLDNWVDAAGYAVCGGGLVVRDRLNSTASSEPCTQECADASRQG